MIIALGIACTAWTLYECVRLLAPSTPSDARAARPESAPPGIRRPRPNRPSQYRAWDASGRPIEVVDLG